ncbi:MAG: PPC domain-containing protein [Caldilinea sp.]
MSQIDLNAPVRRQRVAQVFLILLLGLAPLFTVISPVFAQVEATPILLGEFARAQMKAGDEAAYSLMIPDDGVYTFVYTGGDSAETFLMTIIDAAGDELYSDAMAPEVNLELAAGEHLFLFTAQADAELGFVVGVEGGSMTADPDAPGQLFNGVTFLTEDVRKPLYAIVTIEKSPYPQQMGVLVQGGDGDVYEAELTSTESFDYASLSTDTSDHLRMITTGGEYLLTITPIEGGELLQVSIFLSGPAPVLELGVETEGQITPDDSNTYQFTVEEVGAGIEIVASADADIELHTGFEPGVGKWSAYGSDSDAAVLTFIAPKPGVYYVEVKTYAEAGASYTIKVEERGRAANLALNEPTVGKAPAGSSTGYIVNVEEPESFLIVVLVGADDSDIDLAVSRYKDGDEVASDSSRSFGSREIVGLYADEPAQYFVTVDGSWADKDVEFVLLASHGLVAHLLAEVEGFGAADSAESQTPMAEGEAAPNADGSIEQWASAAEASSEYTDDSWSAKQATGAPDTLEAGDKITAWAALNADVQEETLVLTFDVAVIPTGIEIYETYNPGAVVKVEVLDLNTDEWIVVWEGVADTVGEEIAVFSPPLSTVEFATNQVRLTIDEPSVPGWNEIDAVRLIGIPE